jgi:hypothetical protein
MPYSKRASNRIPQEARRLGTGLTWIGAAVFLLASWAPAVLAAESLKDGAKQAGHDLGQAMRDIGHGAKRVGKEIGHDAKQAGKAVGEAAKEGGREFKRAVKGEH